MTFLSRIDFTTKNTQFLFCLLRTVISFVWIYLTINILSFVSSGLIGFLSPINMSLVPFHQRYRGVNYETLYPKQSHALCLSSVQEIVIVISHLSPNMTLEVPKHNECIL